MKYLDNWEKVKHRFTDLWEGKPTKTPYIKFIQYTPNPGESCNGIGHLEFYRQIQRAGKIVHIRISSTCVEERLIKELDPSKILLDITGEITFSKAENVLNKIAEWSA